MSRAWWIVLWLLLVNASAHAQEVAILVPFTPVTGQIESGTQQSWAFAAASDTAWLPASCTSVAPASGATSVPAGRRQPCASPAIGTASGTTSCNVEAATSRRRRTSSGARSTSAGQLAASNPDSANSQFFICFGDATFLDKQYTVWGKVTSGMEFVDALKRGEPVRDPDRIVKMQVAADAKG